MQLITILLSLIAAASHEEWLLESSAPVEYPLTPKVTQLPEEEKKPQETHSKPHKYKYPSKRTSRAPK